MMSRGEKMEISERKKRGAVVRVGNGRSMREVAVLLGVSEVTISRWAKARGVKAGRPGRRAQFDLRVARRMRKGGKTFAEIGYALNVSRQAVQQRLVKKRGGRRRV